MSRPGRVARAAAIGLVASVLGVAGGDVKAARPAFAAASPEASDGSLLRGVALRRAARVQYGNRARLVGDGHLLGLRVRVGRRLRRLDVRRAVREQFGAGWILSAVGAGAADWRAFHLGALDHQTVPVVLVASDQLGHVAAVQDALDRYASVLGVVDAWYGLRAGVAPRLVRPLIVPTERSSSNWADLSTISSQDAHRYDLYQAELSAMQKWFPFPTARWRAAIAPFVGTRPDLWLGAADGGPVAVGAPRETSVSCDPALPLSTDCSDASYAMGHELGHAYGLTHSCDTYPQYSNCGDSIMQTGKPMSAILLPPEVQTLRASPFLDAAGR